METENRKISTPFTNYGNQNSDTQHIVLTNDAYSKLIDDNTAEALIFAFYCVILGAVSTLGSAANILNIVVFLKQGLSDTVNISLLGLAVSDLGALVTVIWMSICYNPLFQYSDIPFESSDIMYLTAGYPHVTFVRITSWITAFITFERCLSIALPIRVKDIITVGRAKGAMIAIFLGLFFSNIPAFYIIRIAPAFVPRRNKTMNTLVYIPGGHEAEEILHALNIFNQLAPFIPVVICTVILISSLIRQSKWRGKSTSFSTSGVNKIAMAVREKKVVKMVTFISCMFIAFLLPGALNTLPMILLSPEFSVSGKYQNIYRVTWGVLTNLEALNSSLNIFVYYNMSSKYRATFQQLFCRTKQ